MKNTRPDLSAPRFSLSLRLASERDRTTIYRMRHSVYAGELRQHPTNPQGLLSDSLDAHNVYIVASLGDELVGFVSVTPPGRSYSIDKYLPRHEWPLTCDESLFEIRLLTVVPGYRRGALGGTLVALLMYAAFRWVEAHGGRRIVAIGRREVLGIYRKVGLEPSGRKLRSGAVCFELMSAPVDRLRTRAPYFAELLRRRAPTLDWSLDIPIQPSSICFHGGAFFEGIGKEFDRLERSRNIINADVLDAWFPPAPSVMDALREWLPWLLRTSPPTDAAGLVRTISRVRGIAPDCLLAGAGSSDLIFLALREWLTRRSRVLLLDPTYGEYLHLCQNVIGCSFDRLVLSRDRRYRLDLSELEKALRRGYDAVILVNPNNPTGQHVGREDLEAVLRGAPERSRVWVDEAYVDYVGSDQSLERFATGTSNVVVCKSLSKVYALSGLRAAYLCAAAPVLEGLRRLTPPWAVSLPAQVAATRALQAPDYYADCYRETHVLRDGLARGLAALDVGMDVMPGAANYLMCRLPEAGPEASTLAARCQRDGLYIRDLSCMGREADRHAIRVAVKDDETQRKMLEILGRSLREMTPSLPNREATAPLGTVMRPVPPWPGEF